MRVIEYQNLKWLDILAPSDKDVKFLQEQFGFHHLIVEEIRTPTYHPLIASYNTYLFWILHFPHFNSDIQKIQAAEIDFLITKEALVTVRYQHFDDFDEIFEAARSNPAHYMHKTTGHIFYYLHKQLFSKTFPELDRIKASIDDSEDEIFSAFDEKIIEQIAGIERGILDFLRAVKPQKSIWDSAPDVAIEFWGDRVKPYFLDLVADYSRILYFVETHKEIIDSLHLASSSLLDNKRNHVMKVLTIFTAIILPLSLFASTYGMNLAHLPFAQNPVAFWLFSGGMLAATVLALLFLRKRHWL